MLEEIINELGDNYNSNDRNVLEKILNEVATNALIISNRTNTEDNVNLLKREIKECVKGIYLQRGAEGTKSLNERGISTTFEDNMNKMRNDIIKNGKRLCY